jgi:hypothetical protein
VVATTRKLPEKEQIELVYGEKGKFAAFLNDWLQPFVSEQEHQPIKVAGVALPLAPGYHALLNQEQKFSPVLGPDKPFLAGVFEFTQPSVLGKVHEGAGGTTLEIDCKERKFVAATRPESLADSRVNVYWSPTSCIEARLRIALPDPPPPLASAPMPAAAQPSPRLTRSYSGPEGFVRLLQEFTDGAQSFRLGDFRQPDRPAQWQEAAQGAGALGVDNARVYLKVTISEEMERYLGASGAAAAVPARIFE